MNINIDQVQVSHVLEAYLCDIKTSKVTPLGNGLINTTYLVSSPARKFVLQRINHHVFTQPNDVINNADLINDHLYNKKQLGEYQLEPIWQVKSSNGNSMVQYKDNSWRAIQFIPNCYTVEEVSSAKQAREVARAFGAFTCALSDFPAEKLSEIITDFHNLDARITQLKTAKQNNSHQRLTKCHELVATCLAETAFISEVADIITQLPIQVTHNDTKINNLLFAKATNEPIAVIDLDTCMPGFVMHDFGDMVRTCCSNLPEDGTNLDQMTISMDIFKGLSQGYIESFNGQLSELEKQSLVIGAQLLPFMIGVRFLTDYLNGDSYFHTQYNTHNLDRALNQINMYQLLKSKREELSRIVSQTST
ncbi:phosphotransferase enzyme family protein [Thalassotalea sediminis]|uniref:phosphotransferase enzyme family protein n=1 Tax=Thalassotalea sediminis TaxID=1759089 RepID=UPI0025736913|nr:aminoglycoside phosphotransferase family protein [Thalassotalea sediminis]